MKLVDDDNRLKFLEEIKDVGGGGVNASVITPEVSLYGLEKLLSVFEKLVHVRLIVPSSIDILTLVGSDFDRRFRNRLQNCFLATRPKE